MCGDPLLSARQLFLERSWYSGHIGSSAKEEFAEVGGNFSVLTEKKPVADFFSRTCCNNPDFLGDDGRPLLTEGPQRFCKHLWR